MPNTLGLARRRKVIPVAGDSIGNLGEAGKQLGKMKQAVQSSHVDLLKNAQFSMPVIPNIKPARVENLASDFYERLSKWIRDFDAGLDEEHEVGVRLVNFGQAVTFHLEDMGYWNPALISFKGTTEGGDPVELVQHVSQISVLLLKLERQDKSKPKNPIGFCPQPSDEGGQA
jgi:hypothetical protein